LRSHYCRSVILSARGRASFLCHVRREQDRDLQGTVKEFEWTNPHSWLRVNVADEKSGRTVLWALEMSSPARLTTMGMHADTVKVGDKVSVTFHPMRDGTRGGQFIPGRASGRQAGRPGQRARRERVSSRYVLPNQQGGPGFRARLALLRSLGSSRCPMSPS
jgi:hypothetical protein